MGVLAEFLKTEGPRIHEESLREREAADEWAAAVGKLHDQMKRWLSEADTTGSIAVTGVDDPVEDLRASANAERPSPRAYWPPPKLILTLGTRRVNVYSKGRAIAGSMPLADDPTPHRLMGRVDMQGDAGGTLSLYRIVRDGRDEWHLLTDADALRPFDREAFERCLTSLFR